MEKRLLEIAQFNKNNSDYNNKTDYNDNIRVNNNGSSNNGDSSYDESDEDEIGEEQKLSGGAYRRKTKRRGQGIRGFGGKLKQRAWKDLLSTAITGDYDMRTGRQKGRALAGSGRRKTKRRGGRLSRWNMVVAKKMPAYMRRFGPKRAMKELAKDTFRGRGRAY